MHGKGIMKWKDGREFDGEFSNDLRVGRGNITEADGNVYIGVFKDGKLIEREENA